MSSFSTLFHKAAISCACALVPLMSCGGGDGGNGHLQTVNRFACGGSVEAEVWASWDGDTYMRSILVQHLLQDRLIRQHDTYALYDFQLIFNNTLSMAERCGRTDRIRQVSDLIRTAYSVLEQSSAGRKWICRGGSICTDNGLMGEEVVLCSSQFLAFATQVANALAKSGAALTAEDTQFINDTTQIAAEHLVRWGNDQELGLLEQLITTTSEDVPESGAGYIFSDKSLWQISIYSHLSGLRQWQRNWGVAESVFINIHDTRMRSHLSALLRLFNVRISLQRTASGRFGVEMADVELADLDRGFWRLVDESSYAGYEDNTKPVVCSPTAQLNVQPSASTRRDDTGWDFSHARRLVHGLDALERNRETLKTVFGVSDAELPSTALPRDFAATLVNLMWNGDKAAPLFSNYWGGANGWYRVRYSSSICSEGVMPYGLTASFPAGGYITWAKHFPLIGELGVRMYDMMKSSEGSQSPFMTKYYRDLSSAADSEAKAIEQFSFIPTLVGVTNVVGR